MIATETLARIDIARRAKRAIMLIACAVITGCSGNLKSHQVYAIEKTQTYHREGCPPTNMAKTKVMTVADAKARKFKACPGCKPDID